MAEIMKTWTVGDKTFDTYAEAVQHRKKSNRCSIEDAITKILEDWDALVERHPQHDRSAAQHLLAEFNITRKRVKTPE